MRGAVASSSAASSPDEFRKAHEGAVLALTLLNKVDEDGYVDDGGQVEGGHSMSALIAYVKSGEEVVLTDLGRPVARLTPIQNGVWLRLPSGVTHLSDKRRRIRRAATNVRGQVQIISNSGSMQSFALRNNLQEHSWPGLT